MHSTRAHLAALAFLCLCVMLVSNKCKRPKRSIITDFIVRLCYLSGCVSLRSTFECYRGTVSGIYLLLANVMEGLFCANCVLEDAIVTGLTSVPALDNSISHIRPYTRAQLSIPRIDSTLSPVPRIFRYRS